MEIFNGWYRESLARKNMVWHRVHRVDSVLTERQSVWSTMATALCGKRIPAKKCDFDINPDHMCFRCEKYSNTSISKTFAPISSTPTLTKIAAVKELRRLSKPRIYYVWIHDCYGIKIKAIWDSYIDISVYSESVTITQRRKNKVFTLTQVQEDLGRFKSAVNCLCDASKKLAIKEKRKNKLKGSLTEYEEQRYFEKLLTETEG